MNACAEHAQFCPLARSGGSNAIPEQIQIDWDGPAWAAFCLCWWEVCVHKKLKKRPTSPGINQASNSLSMESKDYPGIPLLVPNRTSHRIPGPRSVCLWQTDTHDDRVDRKISTPCQPIHTIKDPCFAKLQGACRVARFFSILNLETSLQLKLNWQ